MLTDGIKFKSPTSTADGKVFIDYTEFSILRGSAAESCLLSILLSSCFSTVIYDSSFASSAF